MFNVGDPVRNAVLTACFIGIALLTVGSLIPWKLLGATGLSRLARWVVVPVLGLAVVYEATMPPNFDIRVDLLLLAPLYAVVLVATAVRWLPSLFGPRLGQEIAEGDLFEVTGSFDTTVLTHWSAPYTGGFKATIPAGVRLKAVTRGSAREWSCTFVPADRADFERRFVPATDVVAVTYAGVSLPLSAGQIRGRLRRVSMDGY
jgi:hypothetical protein